MAYAVLWKESIPPALSYRSTHSLPSFFWEPWILAASATKWSKCLGSVSPPFILAQTDAPPQELICMFKAT